MDVVRIRREIGDEGNLPNSLQELGACERRMDRMDDARLHLREAIAACKPGDTAPALALGELANLEPAVLSEATHAIEGSDSRGVISVRGPYLLWTATGEEKHLERARANLEDLESRIPPEYRTSARNRVQIYREVVRG